MTKRQREQVVDMLRCAFDARRSIATTAAELGVDRHTRMLAIDARCDVGGEVYVRGVELDYGYTCLEASIRVEEGNWP